jgi:hypothetical protein
VQRRDHRLDDRRKAVRQVIARPAVEAHPIAGLGSNESEAIMLDLVQPDVAGGSTQGCGWRHGAMKPADKKDGPGRRLGKHGNLAPTGRMWSAFVFLIQGSN